VFEQILITGGAGFIGSHLIPKMLKKGFKVRVLDTLSSQIHGLIPSNLEWLNDDIEFIRGSVSSRRDWEKALQNIDMVIHLAAETGTGQSMYEIAHYNKINTQSTALMFDVVQRMPISRVKRILLASSRSVYGEGAYECTGCDSLRVYPKSRSLGQLMDREWELKCPHCNGAIDAVATKESDLVLPASIYAATKYAQEDLVRIASEALGIEYITYRFQNVYGEGQSLNNPYTGILSIFSTKIRLDKLLPLFEDGQESRDFVHVDDVTDALLCGLAVNTAPNTVINIGSGVATSVKDIAVKLAHALNKKPNIEVTGQYRLGDIRHNFAEIKRLKEYFHFKPRITLEAGLKRFAAWVDNQSIPEDKSEKANDELRQLKLMN
jgi:dTDP-L-rhamnose 4-epimerase